MFVGDALTNIRNATPPLPPKQRFNIVCIRSWFSGSCAVCLWDLSVSLYVALFLSSRPPFFLSFRVLSFLFTAMFVAFILFPVLFSWFLVRMVVHLSVRLSISRFINSFSPFSPLNLLLSGLASEHVRILMYTFNLLRSNTFYTIVSQWRFREKLWHK